MGLERRIEWLEVYLGSRIWIALGLVWRGRAMRRRRCRDGICKMIVRSCRLDFGYA